MCIRDSSQDGQDDDEDEIRQRLIPGKHSAEDNAPQENGAEEAPRKNLRLRRRWRGRGRWRGGWRIRHGRQPIGSVKSGSTAMSRPSRLVSRCRSLPGVGIGLNTDKKTEPTPTPPAAPQSNPSPPTASPV